MPFAVYLILLPVSGSAQQQLNLDFEKAGIEGLSRPWGWDLSTYTDTKIALDSTVQHRGRYSLKMEAAENTGDQVLTFFLEAYELKGSPLIVKGWIKTEALQGVAGFTLTVSTTEDTAVTEIKSEPITHSTDWTSLSLSTGVSGEVTSVALSVHFEGSGTVWFDDLSLEVNGKEKQQLRVAPAFTGEQVNWLRDHSHTLSSIDAGQPDNRDLSVFRASVGGARIIAAGESTHGTSEFFRLKHRLLEYCVKEAGVRIFAIEDHPLVVNRVNKYVSGGEGTARSSMYGMLGVWQTEEVHALIEWIRAYNDLHPEDKIEFIGFDIQNHNLAIDSLYSFLSRQSPVLYQSSTELLGDLKANGGNSYFASDSAKQLWFTNAKKVLNAVSGQSEAWLREAKNRHDSVAILQGVQYATLVKQFAENACLGHASLYRDVAMAENVSWILDVYKPGSKMLIWAHDAHISRGDHPDSTCNIYAGRSMGAHLSEKYGAYYKAFGLFTYQGKYSCYISYTDFRLTDCPLYTAPEGSLDEALHRVSLHNESPNLFLDLREGRTVHWLIQPVPLRFANHVNIEYGYWTRYSIPYQFDGIFFMDKTTSASSYARK